MNGDDLVKEGVQLMGWTDKGIRLYKSSFGGSTSKKSKHASADLEVHMSRRESWDKQSFMREGNDPV